MASEMLNEVLKAESKATEEELSARKQAELIINTAKINAQEIIAEAHRKSQASSKTHLAAAKKQADEIIALAVAEASTEGVNIKSAAKQKQSDAVNAVKKFILP